MGKYLLSSIAANAVIGVIIAICIIALAIYILLAMLQYKTCRAFNGKVAWLSFVPILNYIPLILAGDDGSGKVAIGKWKINRVVFSLWVVLMIVLSAKGYTFLATVVETVCYGYAVVDLYAKMDNKSRKDSYIMAFLSGLIPLIAYIKFAVFLSRNMKNVAEEA